MSINIEEITAVSWFKTYKVPLESASPYRKHKAETIEFASRVAVAVLEQVIREVGAVAVMAPDAEIVKEKLTSRLRLVASEMKN